MSKIDKKKYGPKAIVSPFDTFATDKNKEQEGAWLDFGSYSIKVRRLGASNKPFAKMLAETSRPYEADMKNGTMDDAKSDAILINVFVKTVLVAWRTNANESTGQEEVMGMLPGEDGTPSFKYDDRNAVALFTQLPDMFTEVYNRASSMTEFKQNGEESTAGK